MTVSQKPILEFMLGCNRLHGFVSTLSGFVAALAQSHIDVKKGTEVAFIKINKEGVVVQ